MIRILYVADSLMAGGIESQLVAVATNLDRACVDPRILCLYGPTARALYFAPALEAAGVSYTTLDLGWSARDKMRGIHGIIVAVRQFTPDLIQAEGYHSNLLLRLAAPLLPRNLRLIGTVRGRLSRKQLLYERLGSRFCARLVVNAPHLKEMLVTQAGIAARRVCVIVNGIDIERFATPSTVDARHALVSDATRVFVSMGRISFEKNMHWIAAALGLLKQQGRLEKGIKVFIVGPPHHAEAQALLDATIHKFGLDDVVVQHPQTNAPKDYYAACDVSILVSPSEGLPNVAIESLSAGRPVIISAAANAAQVIEDGSTGWVVRTGDIAHLADTIARVAALPDETLLGMRPVCMARASDYSVQRLYSRYMSLYVQLAPGGTERGLGAT
jgi:glycosyltransferase involved in cell wall biosynthesis